MVSKDKRKVYRLVGNYEIRLNFRTRFTISRKFSAIFYSVSMTWNMANAVHNAAVIIVFMLKLSVKSIQGTTNTKAFTYKMSKSLDQMINEISKKYL